VCRGRSPRWGLKGRKWRPQADNMAKISALADIYEPAPLDARTYWLKPSKTAARKKAGPGKTWSPTTGCTKSWHSAVGRNFRFVFGCCTAFCTANLQQMKVSAVPTQPFSQLWDGRLPLDVSTPGIYPRIFPRPDISPARFRHLLSVA